LVLIITRVSNERSEAIGISRNIIRSTGGLVCGQHKVESTTRNVLLMRSAGVWPKFLYYSWVWKEMSTEKSSK
jgi:hypothetical protein